MRETAERGKGEARFAERREVHAERRQLSSDLPCAREPAWDSGYVQNGKVAEVEGVEVQIFEQGLQSLMGSRPLQSQQRSVIMNDEVCLLAVALHGPN